MSRDVCPDALATEVYTLTLAKVRRRYPVGSVHQQTIPDVVGEAFVRWLARKPDTSKYAAKAHAHFLTLTVLHYLSCPRTYRAAANHARPCAEWAMSAGEDGSDFQPTAAMETTLRVMRGASEAAADHEEDVIEQFDAARLYHARYFLGRPAATMAEALAVLVDRGWSVKQVAAGVGVSENAVHHWTKGARRPTDASIAAVIRLATTDGLPPILQPKAVRK